MSGDDTTPLPPEPDPPSARAEDAADAATGTPVAGAGEGLPGDDEAVGGNAAADGAAAGAADAADADGAADAADAAGLEEVLDPLTAMTIERDEYLDGMRRVQADFENYKKRTVRQQTEQLERAAEGLVVKLLPALDTLSLALSHTEADTDAGKALSQVSTAMWDVLGREGLEIVEPLDQEFDPNEAEAVMHEPAEGDQTGSVVVEVFRPGYRWRGRVLRAAMVKVRG